MSYESALITPTPLQIRRDGIDDDVGKKHANLRSKRELQIVSFGLPEGWLVERRPRLSKPSHIDKYYYEPGTGKQFRSLLSVKRYLAEKTGDYLITDRMMAESANTSVVKSGTRKPRARGVRSSQRPVYRHSSVSEEERITLKASKHTMKSRKSDYLKKTDWEKNNGASMHNLTAPPAKVSWVLSGPGGFWTPFLEDCIVPESEKLKWSEAFVLSTNHGVANALHS
ncbi:methyl-CpG-binding domain-containing protein 7 isoform X2 [Abrus precatorius]|uniref:Methyl-CpG-binding domain-containing protein 7 isoform X2 n=1 Tax=Abrus precatorius TaxID=3816 RepID=A0A8B8KMW7_ABRPR|nr:methyl-CpG-binding domain-containing protein 7 isoform X2 [Abrus precatorius]